MYVILVNRKEYSTMDYETVGLLTGVLLIVGVKVYFSYKKYKPENNSKKVQKWTWKNQNMVYVISKAIKQRTKNKSWKKLEKSSKSSLKKTENRVY